MVSVHFVGSVGLDTPEEVFAAIGEYCGEFLRRVPDGEPGGRRMWVSWQIPVLRGNPSLAQVGECQYPLRLASGVAPIDVHFGELGYYREARTSYQDFLSARDGGQFPPSVRFQVSLPTPWAVVSSFIDRADVQVVFPAYEQAMLREVARICEAIPHRDLAVQWDVCIEMLAWDTQWRKGAAGGGLAESYAGNFGRLGSAVPSDVELGFHLCYGDLDAKHFVNPRDAGAMTELANFIVGNASRPVTWVHIPVPIDRADDAFFEPLRELHLGPETELYLGVVHAQDGVEGTRKRMAVAAKVLPSFGIASECGISRGRSASVAMDFIKTYGGAAGAS
jgi:hypothetical protein